MVYPGLVRLWRHPCRQGTPRRGGQVGCGPVDRCLQPVIEHVLGNPIYL
jgi:hypothetical protein